MVAPRRSVRRVMVDLSGREVAPWPSGASAQALPRPHDGPCLHHPHPSRRPVVHCRDPAAIRRDHHDAHELEHGRGAVLRLSTRALLWPGHAPSTSTVPGPSTALWPLGTALVRRAASLWAPSLRASLLACGTEAHADRGVICGCVHWFLPWCVGEVRRTGTKQGTCHPRQCAEDPPRTATLRPLPLRRPTPPPGPTIQIGTLWFKTEQLDSKRNKPPGCFGGWSCSHRPRGGTAGDELGNFASSRALDKQVERCLGWTKGWFRMAGAAGERRTLGSRAAEGAGHARKDPPGGRSGRCRGRSMWLLPSRGQGLCGMVGLWYP